MNRSFIIIVLFIMAVPAVNAADSSTVSIKPTVSNSKVSAYASSATVSMTRSTISSATKINDNSREVTKPKLISRAKLVEVTGQAALCTYVNDQAIMGNNSGQMEFDISSVSIICPTPVKVGSSIEIVPARVSRIIPAEGVRVADLMTIQGVRLNEYDVFLGDHSLQDYIIESSSGEITIRAPMEMWSGELELRLKHDSRSILYSEAYRIIVKPFDLFSTSIPDSSPQIEKNAFLMAMLSTYIYDKRKSFVEGENISFASYFDNRAVDFGFVVKKTFSNSSGTDYAIVEYRDSIILVFRGTQGYADVLTDLQLLWLEPGSAWGDRTLVHTGFYNMWNEIESTVLSDLYGPVVLQGKKLVITGHSLGGALATLAAYRLKKEANYPVEAVYTFGSPKVGNYHFRNNYIWQGLHSITHRWVVLGDTVVSALGSANIFDFSYTPEELEYRHVGQLFNIALIPNYSEQSHIDGFNYTYEQIANPTPSDYQEDQAAGVTGLQYQHVLYDEALYFILNDLLSGDDASFKSLLNVLPQILNDV